ncbi:MAG: hypothetical protein HY908_29010 [Myxococcales bacterium]|nr:hypothetical protein [Myxococcales bacterium]
MAGPPRTPEDALAWAKAAMISVPRRYIIDGHVYTRLAQRRMTDRSIWFTIKNATICAAYVPDRPCLTDGTSWRITGPDEDDEPTSVGVETFVDHLGERLLIITVF